MSITRPETKRIIVSPLEALLSDLSNGRVRSSSGKLYAALIKSLLPDPRPDVEAVAGPDWTVVESAVAPVLDFSLRRDEFCYYWNS